MFVVRARRTYGAFIAALAGLLFVPGVRQNQQPVVWTFAFARPTTIMAGRANSRASFIPPAAAAAPAPGS